MDGIKELHVYVDLEVNTISDNEMDELYNNHFETQMVINNGPYNKPIRTTDLTQLGNSWDYIDKGWRIFIHSKNGTLEVKEGMEGTSKDIKPGHNILKLLLGGAFEIKSTNYYHQYGN